MKSSLLFAWSTCLACGTLLAAEPGSAKSEVRINLDEPATSAPAKPAAGKSTASGTTKPDAKAAPKKADKTGKEKEVREVAGFSISRGDHGYLGLKIEDNTFKARFYDKEKKPIPADVAAVALRWPVQYQPNPERTLLAPSDDGKVMTSDKTVRPPFHFKLYVTLLKSMTPGEDAGDETYVVEFAQ